MRTKKIRLGIVMAAMSAVVGGMALGAAQTTALAETGYAGSSTSAASPDQTSKDVPVVSLASFDWN